MVTKENWYQAFFSDLAMELWQNVLPQAYTDSELKFILEEANLTSNARILDVPCGTGRLSIPLAQKGFRVTGIDIAESSIRMLNELKGAHPVDAIRADILEYQINDTFDLAICMGNSFSYFHYATMVAFAKKIQDALKPGAKFIINTGAVAEGLLP